MDKEETLGEMLAERRYVAARERTKRLTLDQIDTKLNVLGVPHALRDEIVERLCELERYQTGGRSG